MRRKITDADALAKRSFATLVRRWHEVAWPEGSAYQHASVALKVLGELEIARPQHRFRCGFGHQSRPSNWFVAEMALLLDPTCADDLTRVKAAETAGDRGRTASRFWRDVASFAKTAERGRFLANSLNPVFFHELTDGVLLPEERALALLTQDHDLILRMFGYSEPEQVKRAQVASLFNLGSLAGDARQGEFLKVRSRLHRVALLDSITLRRESTRNGILAEIELPGIVRHLWNEHDSDVFLRTEVLLDDVRTAAEFQDAFLRRQEPATLTIEKGRLELEFRAPRILGVRDEEPRGAGTVASPREPATGSGEDTTAVERRPKSPKHKRARPVQLTDTMVCRGKPFSFRWLLGGAIVILDIQGCPYVLVARGDLDGMDFRDEANDRMVPACGFSRSLAEQLRPDALIARCAQQLFLPVYISADTVRCVELNTGLASEWPGIESLRSGPVGDLYPESKFVRHDTVVRLKHVAGPSTIVVKSQPFSLSLRRSEWRESRTEGLFFSLDPEAHAAYAFRVFVWPQYPYHTQQSFVDGASSYFGAPCNRMLYLLPLLDLYMTWKRGFDAGLPSVLHEELSDRILWKNVLPAVRKEAQSPTQISFQRNSKPHAGQIRLHRAFAFVLEELFRSERLSECT